MSHRRKRSKGDRINPVKGAMVINKGGGGGEIKRGKSLEDAQQRRKDTLATRHLDSGDATATKERAERIAHRALQARSGMRMRLRSEASETPKGGETINRIMQAIREERYANGT